MAMGMGKGNHTRHAVHHGPRATTRGHSTPTPTSTPRLLREIEAQGDPLVGMGALVLAAVRVSVRDRVRVRVRDRDMVRVRG